MLQQGNRIFSKKFYKNPTQKFTEPYGCEF